ncbi:MAG: helix-turn-helix transcriptional regulator [Bacteroides sp.]|nr:helix-turn-helix transcriptional regulator [Bacteroides sp.]
MKERIFVQKHPLHAYTEQDRKDYSERDRFFIQSLKAMESMMDIDAYIIDYVNERVLYATRNSLLRRQGTQAENPFIHLDYLDGFISPEEYARISVVNREVYRFFYSLPVHRRWKVCFTQDLKIRGAYHKPVLINHKGSILDLTDSGSLRLTLCINSHPTHDRPGNSYIKMTDTREVYEYIAAVGKFVEVKTQKLTSRSLSVLELASNGKSEQQIACEPGISIHTVKYHKKRIFAQTGAKNTAEAIQWMNNQKKLTE